MLLFRPTHSGVSPSRAHARSSKSEKFLFSYGRTDFSFTMPQWFRQIARKLANLSILPPWLGAMQIKSGMNGHKFCDQCCYFEEGLEIAFFTIFEADLVAFFFDLPRTALTSFLVSFLSALASSLAWALTGSTTLGAFGAFAGLVGVAGVWMSFIPQWSLRGLALTK